jgi:hypothetical protein
MVNAALSQQGTAAQRRRLLRNLAMVATLAGHLAYEDLGDAFSGRAYYNLAAESAREAEDDQAAAITLGYAAQLAHAEGMTAAALNHLTVALAHAERAPAVAPWLASIQATLCADSGDHSGAHDALAHAEPTPRSTTQPDYGPAQLAAATGHAWLQARNHTAARPELAAALDDFPPTARRARVLVLVDLATAELQAGNIPEACRHATTTAELLQRAPYATGITRLHAFRAAAARPIGSRALRVLDEQLAHLAA